MRIGPNGILLIAAVILNVLAAFGVTIGQFQPINLAEFGIASGFASFLV